MTRIHRALVLSVLLGAVVVVGAGFWRLGSRAPGWIALRYAPAAPATDCAAVARRLRAAVERRGPATAEEEALLAAIRTAERCDTDAPAVRALESTAAVEAP